MDQMRARYVNISIHEYLAKEIDKHLDKKKEAIDPKLNLFLKQSG